MKPAYVAPKGQVGICKKHGEQPTGYFGTISTRKHRCRVLVENPMHPWPEDNPQTRPEIECCRPLHAVPGEKVEVQETVESLRWKSATVQTLWLLRQGEPSKLWTATEVLDGLKAAGVHPCLHPNTLSKMAKRGLLERAAEGRYRLAGGAR